MMQKNKKMSARILSMALSVAMVCTMLPATVFAAEGDLPLGASSVGGSEIGTIQSFDKLGGAFIPSVGKDAPSHVYGLSVALNTPATDLNLPTELTAMVERTTTAPAEDEPVVDSGKPSEPAVDEIIPDEDEVVEGDANTDDTVSGNQPASPSDAKEEVKEEIKDGNVPLAPEPEQDKETVVTTVETETIPVTWNSDKEYKSDANGTFIYTAEISEDYNLADGVKLPQIYVAVGSKQARAGTLAHNIGTDGPLTLTDGDGCAEGTPHVVTGTTTANNIIATGTHFVTLDGVSITYQLGASFEVRSRATVHLTLAAGKSNTLTGGSTLPAVWNLGTLIIDGTGSLTATGDTYSAGIGGGQGATGGTVTINGGNVTATGGMMGAGIGGGMEGGGGTVTINGGTVTATGGLGGCGIGGGMSGGGGTVTITDGTVTATGGQGGSGIGGVVSNGVGGGTVTITGGTVTAAGGANAFGIGGMNRSGVDGNIKISDAANVTAYSVTAGFAIGDTDGNITPDSGTAANLMQFDFTLSTPANTAIEVKNASGTSLSPAVSYAPGVAFQSLALTVPAAGDYTVYQGSDKLKFTPTTPGATATDAFVVAAGLNKYADVLGPDTTIAKTLTIGTRAPVSNAGITGGSNPAPTGANNATVTWSADGGTTFVAASGKFAANIAYQSKYIYTAKTGYAFDSTLLPADITVTNLGTGTRTATVSTDKKTLTIVVTWPTTASAEIPDYSGTQAAAPSSTPASKTATGITLAAVTVTGETIEYAKSTGSTAPTSDADWQTSAAFTGLTADTQYYFFARVKANTTHKAGTASTGTAIKTDKTDAQKVAAAKLLAQAALGNLTATNATTANDVLSAINTALADTGVTATWDASGAFDKTDATNDAAGTVTGTIKLTCNAASDTVAVSLPIARLGSDTEKVANAKAAAVAALGSYTATNATADTDIMALVNKAITDAGITGITAAWKSDSGFDKTNATDSATGSVTGTITLKLNSAEADVVVNLTIAQLANKAALTAAITAANSAKSGITVSDNAASSVPSGTRFVTTAEMKALTDAITAAQAVVDSSASTAAQVSAAITTLNSAVTTFNAAIKTGTYSSGGGGGGGGGGSSSTTTPTTKPTEPVTGSSNTNATVDDKGNANVNVTDKNITDAVKAAQDAANKKGVNAGEVTAVINVTAPANSNPNTVTVNLPKTVQQQVISNKIGNLAIVIDKPDISIGMNLATITEMNKQANADIQLSATRTDATKLSTEAKNAIGSRPAFDLKATYANGSKSVTNFGTGTVSVAIPYTLQAGEIAGGVYGVYVDGNGKVNYITNSSYDAENKVLRFATNHFSVYGISYKAPIAFTDIASHWAKTDIEFVVNRGLMSGTSNTTFAPNTAMTRGMFVTALGRLAGVNTKDYQAQVFTDVKTDAYYAPYVNWAKSKNIVAGTTATTFAPDQSITRQEMAVIMSNYAKAMGYTIPETREAVTFADNGSIGSWAASAVKQMQMAGILNGKDGNKFDPTGTATRGEISAMLHRYVELVIDRSTAQGLDTNDSGSAMMYENGKAVKSASRTVGSGTYNFNANGEAALLPADNKKTGTYTVKKGDSFWLIAKKVGCTMTDLEQLNGKNRYDIIYAGQVLKVPQK